MASSCWDWAGFREEVAFPCAFRFDVSEDGRKLQRRKLCGQMLGVGPLFRVFGEPECGLYAGRVKPGIRFDYSKATTDHL